MERTCADPKCGAPLPDGYSRRFRYCTPCRRRRLSGKDVYRGKKPPDHAERIKHGIELARRRRQEHPA